MADRNTAAEYAEPIRANVEAFRVGAIDREEFHRRALHFWAEVPLGFHREVARLLACMAEGSGNDVGEAFGCPKCGERDADRLEIHDDDTVRCETCGTTYGLSEAN